MSKKYYSGSDMYKNHRDMIAQILEQAEQMEEEHDQDCDCEQCMECEEQVDEDLKDYKDDYSDLDESADHPEDCRCKMCKPSIYEGEGEELDKVVVIIPPEKRDEVSKVLSNKGIDHSMTREHDHNIVFTKPKDQSLKEYLSSKGIQSFPYDYELYSLNEDLRDYKDDYSDLDESEEMEESDEDFVEKAKKEIEDESDLAIEVAEDNGQIFDNVAHMDWFVHAVADKLKEDSKLDEKDMTMGHVSSKYDLKKHIANNFDHYKDNIMRLYPQDLKNTKEVFLRFLKDQELDKEKLNELSKTLAKKIREVGDAYDEMAQFVDMVIQVSK
jgi:hypothetical protein